MDDLQFDALQPLLGNAIAARLDAKRDIPGLFQSVVALGKLGLEHIGILGTEIVERIPIGRHDDAFFQRFLPAVQIEERKLEADGAVEVVEEVAPALKDRRLVVVLQ